jgi:hypothetical protein
MNQAPLSPVSLRLMVLRVAFGVCSLLFSGGTEAAQPTTENQVSSAYSLRVISLRVLQDRLKDCRRRSHCSAEVLHLAGLTDVLGYIVDQTRRDVMLFGRVDAGKPALYLDDFVVALRNARGAYAPLRGNTYYYAYPGCSIDPDPSIVGQLRDIQLRSQSTPGQAWDSQISRWNNVCRAPQQVKVFGIPFNSRFARTMVQADYDMKTLVDGTDKLELPGLISLVDRKMHDIGASIRQERPIAVSVGMSRFWFYPGKQHYEESADKDIVFLADSPVELLTEEMYLGDSGTFVGGQRPDDMARRFAADLSRLYDKLAARRPVYHELGALFRFFALAQAITDRGVLERAGLDLSYLLNEYPITEIAVETRLPGRSGHRRLRESRETAQGYAVLEIWMPSCGGVSIQIPKNPDSFHREKLGGLAELRDHLLSSHPPSHLHSTVSASGSWQRIAHRHFVRRVNATSRHFNLVRIRQEATGFVVSHDGSEYEVKSGREFAERFRETANAQIRDAVYLQLVNFSSKSKEDGFVFSANTRLAQHHRVVRQLSLVDAVSSGWQQRGDPTPITQLYEGPFKGGYAAAVNVVTATDRGLKQIVLRVKAKSKELVAEFLRIFSVRLATDLAASSLLDLVNAVRLDLSRNYGISDKELAIDIENEAGDVQIVIRHFSHARALG